MTEASLSGDSYLSESAIAVWNYLTTQSRGGVKQVVKPDDQIARRALGSGSVTRTIKARYCLMELVDQGYINRLEDGVWEVLVCSELLSPLQSEQEMNSPRFGGISSQFPTCAPGVGEDWTERRAEARSGGKSSPGFPPDGAKRREGGCSTSSRTTAPGRTLVRRSGVGESLARDYFPTACSRYGPFGSWVRFQRYLQSWLKEGIPGSTIRLMMDEFAKHPDWMTRRQRPVPAWVIFIQHKETLLRTAAKHSNRPKDCNDIAWFQQ